MASSWRFSGPHLTKAVEEWREAHKPSVDQVEAFCDWALAVSVTGPPEDSLCTPEEEEYVALVVGARAFVVFLAVEQDRMIFLRRLDAE